MKVAIVFLACLAYAAASGYHQSGFQHISHGVVAPYRNAERQRAVNHVAEHVGSGTGTAKYYDVPGADGHYRHHGHGHDGYGRQYGFNSYGYGLHAHAGHAAHAGPAYGHAGHAYGHGAGLGYGHGFGFGRGFGFGHAEVHGVHGFNGHRAGHY